MPATSKVKHNGLTLTFTEADHKYVDSLGMTYTSVTTLLKHYFPQFDAEATAKRMEEEGKGNAMELLAEWDQKREDACDYGTRCHTIAEDALLGRKPSHTPRDDREKESFRLVWEYSKKQILGTLEVIKPELVVFKSGWCSGIAGTIDLPARSEDGTVHLLDWKTNAKLRSEGFQGQTALAPIEHMQDCEMSKYGLQLSIYQQILVWAGYVPRTTKFKRAVLWVKPEESVVEMIQLPDYEKEALSILLDWCTDKAPF